MTFGENLKTLRISRSISQKELATELGFSFQNISKWERNESLPDIETLIEIAKYFGTTTDALLGVASEIKFSTLEIAKNEVTIYQDYPETETTVSGKLLFAIDSESKIAGIVFIPHMRAYRTGYTRNGYEPLADQSTLIYKYRCNSRCGNVVGDKRIKIPENGFLIAVSDETIAAKKIMKFITPEEYDAFLNPETHPGYYNTRNGKSLFGETLRQNELDDITVKLTDTGIFLQKRLDSVDPMLVNIETLTKIVRKELQKEHEKQIRQLMDRIDDLEDRIDDLEGMVGDNESHIEDLNGRMNEIEMKFSEEDT